jgi:hypothetical protein
VLVQKFNRVSLALQKTLFQLSPDFFFVKQHHQKDYLSSTTEMAPLKLKINTRSGKTLAEVEASTDTSIEELKKLFARTGIEFFFHSLAASLFFHSC